MRKECLVGVRSLSAGIYFIAVIYYIIMNIIITSMKEVYALI